MRLTFFFFYFYSDVAPLMLDMNSQIVKYVFPRRDSSDESSPDLGQTPRHQLSLKGKYGSANFIVIGTTFESNLVQQTIVVSSADCSEE